MARLPQPGADAGNWGDILNEYLGQTLASDGKLKPDSVTNSVIANQSVSEQKLSTEVQTKLNSTSLADLSVTTAKIADQAVTISKIDGIGDNNGIASLDNTGKLPEAQVPDRLGEEALANAIGIEYQDEVATGIAFAVVDEAGRRTEIEVGRDGKFTSRVVQSLQSRMVFPSTTFTVPQIAGPNILLVGHSMLAGAASAITTTLSNVITTSLSVGGETSRAIAARQGGQPAVFKPVGGSFPASGAVDVTLGYADGGSAWPLLQGSATYLGHVTLPSGTTIPGTFGIIRDPAATQYVHHSGDRYTFTRTTAGTAATVFGGAPFYYDIADQARSNIFVIWAGRNNYAETDQVIGDIQAMVQHQFSQYKRFVILSEHNASTAASGSSEWTQIKTLNDRLRQLYGRRFIDTRRYLIDSGLAHAGLAPTTQDTTDISNDVVPISLRADNLHLNGNGSTIVAALIKSRLIELGWY